MNILNFFLKKSRLISNDSLVPVLTKNITEDILKDYSELEVVHYYDDINSKYDDPSLTFSIEKFSSFLDSSGIVYGWIITEHGECNLVSVNLIKYFPQDKQYISLFDFEFTKGIVENYRFGKNSSLYEYENSAQICMDSIQKFASFNAYTTTPPYVIFAKMIDLK